MDGPAEGRSSGKNAAGSHSDVVEYLVSLGVDVEVANQARLATWLALSRYSASAGARLALTAKRKAKGPPRDAQGDKSAKGHAAKIARAAAALAAAIEASPDTLWNALEEVYATDERGIVCDADARNALRLKAQWRERIGPAASFAANVRIVRDAADEALARLKVSGRPAEPKSVLVDELAVIWRRATGRPPTASGAGELDSPHSRFGEFVRRAVSGHEDEFRGGFADLLKHGVARYRPRNAAAGGRTQARN